MLEALGEDDEGAVDEVLGARAGVVVRLGPGSSRDDASVDAGIPRRGGGVIVRVGGGGFLRLDGRGRRGIIRGRSTLRGGG